MDVRVARQKNDPHAPVRQFGFNFVASNFGYAHLLGTSPFKMGASIGQFRGYDNSNTSFQFQASPCRTLSSVDNFHIIFALNSVLSKKLTVIK
jgi:hypothetical protein